MAMSRPMARKPARAMARPLTGAELLGPELADWTSASQETQTVWVWDGGNNELTKSMTSADRYDTDITLEAGKIYEIKVTRNQTAGNMAFAIDLSSDVLSFANPQLMPTGVGVFTYTDQALISGDLNIFGNAFMAVISDISAREVL